MADKKPPIDLVEPAFIKLIAQVMDFGAEKHGRLDWRRGYPWSCHYAAAMRHLLDFWAGQDIDPESGLHALGHAAARIMILYVYWLLELGKDDRMEAKNGR